MDTNNDKSLLRNNPIFVIGIACLLAIIMTFVSVLSYARSDTRKTIEQIQTNNHLLQQDQLPQLKDGEVSTKSLDATEKSITNDIQAHSDETDFSPDVLTDSALGL